MAKKSYPPLNLYQEYKAKLIDDQFSASIPNITTKITLEFMNYALNLCEAWDTCIDIGGGNGHYLAPISTKFKRNILVEIGKFSEHAALVEQNKNIEIQHVFIEDYHDETKADFILLADIFEHIKDIGAFASHIAALQNKGGIVYIMTPNPVTCGPAVESGLYYTLHTNGHIRQYPSSEIKDIMEKHGYRLMFQIYEEGPLRKKVKPFIYALARRDKKYQNHIWYWPLRPLMILLIWPIIKVLETLVYWHEKKNIHNQFGTITQDLAFKKIHDD